MFKGILCTKKFTLQYISFYEVGVGRESCIETQCREEVNKREQKREKKDGHSKRIFTLFNDSLAIPFMKEREG